MNYSQIHYSIDQNIIGTHFPQIQEAIIPTTWDDPAYIGSFINKRAPKNVLVPKAIINQESKVTDLISAASVGLSTNLLISDRLKFLFEVSNYHGVDFFETTLIIPKTKEELKYWIVHSYDSYYEALDIEQTTFFWTDYKLRIELGKEVHFSSAIELRETYKKMYDESHLPLLERKYLLIDIPAFNQDCNVDFLTLYGAKDTGLGYYVSDRLRAVIEKEGCMGIVLTEPNEKHP